MLSVIQSCPDPEAALANFKACIARVNSPELCAAFAQSGFFTLERQEGVDTREEMLSALAAHFGL